MTSDSHHQMSYLSQLNAYYPYLHQYCELMCAVCGAEVIKEH